jgi:hypothetical protein
MAAACRTGSARPRPMHRRYRPNDNTLRGLVVRNVACSALLHLLTAVRGPGLPTWATQQSRQLIWGTPDVLPTNSERQALTPTGSRGDFSRTVCFRSSTCRKAAQKLKQRRVDLGRPLLLKPVASILHENVAKVGALLAHQFDHIDAGYHAEDCFEAASHKGGRVRN